MSLWIKICGNTTLDDARLAVDFGADALGFVFAPSPRRVTIEQAAPIAQSLAGRVETIGVFVSESVAEIVETVRACDLTGVQLHGAYDPLTPKELKSRLGMDLKVLRVAHFGPQAAQEAAAFLADPEVAAVLIDSRTATAAGGTGITFDWRLASETIFHNPEARRRLIVAGGLHPDNIAEAIAALHPAAIDVASGVEAAPGRKSPEKLRAFLERARAAAVSLL